MIDSEVRDLLLIFSGFTPATVTKKKRKVKLKEHERMWLSK